METTVISFPECHIVKIIHYIAFSEAYYNEYYAFQFPSCFLHDLIVHSFSALDNIPRSGCTTVIHLLLSLAHVFTIIHSAAVNIHVHILNIHAQITVWM
jgi:hypothetical protein